MSKVIYLDYHSTTPVDNRVLDVMLPYFNNIYGNAASSHIMGEEAQNAIDNAKIKVANIINCKDANNIFFTNSATESNNIIIKTWFNNLGNKKNRYIVSTNSEHSSVYESILNMQKGIKKYILKIKKDGTICLDDLHYILSNNTVSHLTLVSIIAANNEIGTIHNLLEIGNMCKKYGAIFHTDATQAIGKIPIDVNKYNISALTMSGHKIYGPKGVGVLYINDYGMVSPIIHGGYQNVLSSGTQNVPAIVGMGKACDLCNQYISHQDDIKNLRDKMLYTLCNNIDNVIINGTMESRLVNNINITIPGVPAEILIKGLTDVIISGGSACSSGVIESSRIINALGTPYPNCAIRISVGRFTSEEDIEVASKKIIKLCKEYVK